MINLRREAKGRDCTVMVPGVCNRNIETTVLAHLNIRSIFRLGMGGKVPDWAGAFCCSDCHDLIDLRAKSKVYSADEIKVMHLEGVIRTQKMLIDEGMLWDS